MKPRSRRQRTHVKYGEISSIGKSRRGHPSRGIVLLKSETNEQTFSFENAYGSTVFEQTRVFDISISKNVLRVTRPLSRTSHLCEQKENIHQGVPMKVARVDAVR